MRGFDSSFFASSRFSRLNRCPRRGDGLAKLTLQLRRGRAAAAAAAAALPLEGGGEGGQVELYRYKTSLIGINYTVNFETSTPVNWMSPAWIAAL